MPVPKSFAQRILRWFDKHGRHDLPWQHPRTPYRVWLAEVMLQQTQVATVIPYYTRFLRRFPDIDTLARAKADDVLSLWSGLGYYARARNLHRAAQTIMASHDGAFPADFETAAELAGIGRSTAGAILAQAFGQRHAILDGNVRRVLARHGAVAGWPGEPAVQKKLWKLSESVLPAKRLADYTQAIMDLGATLCTARNPRCSQCPLRADCKALALGKVGHYPAPRPRRRRAARSAHLLLAENPAGAILLERRPPAGIWGGLWCPPIVDEGADWRDALERLGMSMRRPRELPAIRHVFSHFDLTLQPLRGRVTRGVQIAEGGNHRWVAPARAAELGLPAPVRKLLASL